MNVYVRQISFTSFLYLFHISNSHHICKNSFTAEYVLHVAKFTQCCGFYPESIKSLKLVLTRACNSLLNYIRTGQINERLRL